MKKQFQIIIDILKALSSSSDIKLLVNENIYNQVINLVDDFIILNSKEEIK